jgi:hypothetical protein
MDIPKTSLSDQFIKVKHTTERKVKHLDTLYSDEFLNAYFSHSNTPQSSNKHS